ncbi:Na(+)/H(+) exchange regulatory cofactor NHE-RF1-like [Amblyomma americanum]
MKLSSPAADQKMESAPNSSDKSAGPTAAPSGVVDLPEGAPAARLCHMVQRPDYDGYGFKLLAVKQRSLPYVLAVEPGSPAEDAGLRPNDIIVEVNGKSLRGAVHQDVVQRVKAIPHEARLLVVDCDTAAWYEEHGIDVRGDLPNIIRISNANASPSKAGKARKKSSSSGSSSGGLTPAELAGGLRLCYLRKWPSFEGYGFNVVSGEERWRYYIANVAPGSPGELGGLREEDRLIEARAIDFGETGR